MGAFSHKFSIAPSGETTDRIKKNGTDLLYHHAKYGMDPGSRAGCRQKKCDVFVCLSVCLFLLSRFRMTKIVIGDFRGVSPHFQSQNSVIWRECTDPGHPLKRYEAV